MRKASNTREVLSDMLAAYENGDAEDDRHGFINGWLTLLEAVTATAAAEAPEVLVQAELDGDGLVLSMSGPYPAGHHDDRAIPENAWVVRLQGPTS